MESQSFPRGSRRRYSAAFKSRLVALACERRWDAYPIFAIPSSYLVIFLPLLSPKSLILLVRHFPFHFVVP